jgi:hypothetical protein
MLSSISTRTADQCGPVIEVAARYFDFGSKAGFGSKDTA